MTAVILAALAVALAMLTWPRPAARLRPVGRSWLATATTAGRLPRLGAAAATGASALLLAAGVGWWALPLAALVAVGSYFILGRLLTGEQERRQVALAAATPQLCDLLAVSLEAGLPLRQATRVIATAAGGPLGELLGGVVARVDLGVDEATAWLDATAKEPALAALGREVARSVEAGSGLARAARVLGLEARREAAAAQEVLAKRVGVRSVLPLMLCFLPAFMLLGIVPIIGGVAGRLF